MVSDPKEAFQDLYAAYDRAELVQAGSAFLHGNLKHRARRHSRWFWIGFAVCIGAVVWLSVLGIIYLLERTRASADGFERQRQQKLDRFNDG